MLGLLLACVPCTLPGSEGAGDPSGIAASPEPSDAETLALEWLNRFRAQPRQEAGLVLAQAESMPGLFEDVDQALFASEMRLIPAAQPLVFDLALISAARNHCRYCLLNGQCHEEDPGNPGFTGITNRERAASAGFCMQRRWAEDVFRDARSILHSHCSFLVDRGPGGSGGMQPGRGHRRNMAYPDFRLAGIGVVEQDGGCCVTHEFSAATSRAIGGVVWIDRAGDHVFAPGCGCAGALITASDGSHCSSWSSGAYALHVRAEELTLTASWHGLSVRAALAPSSDNQHWSWMIEPEQLAGEVRRLADACQAAAPGRRRDRACIALLVAAEGIALDAALEQRVADLSRPWGARLQTSRSAVLAVLDAHGHDAEASIAAQSAPFIDSAASDWFVQASGALKAVRHFAERAIHAPAVATPASRREAVRALEEALAGVCDHALRDRILAAYCRTDLPQTGSGLHQPRTQAPLFGQD